MVATLKSTLKSTKMPTLTSTRLTIMSPRQYIRESEILFARQAANGSEPNSTRKTLIDLTIRRLKDAGIWDKINALWVLRASTSIQANVDWKTPSNPLLTPVNSPVFTADVGYTGDGVSAHILTGYTLSTPRYRSITGEVVSGPAVGSVGQDITTNTPTLVTTLALRNGSGNIFGVIMRAGGAAIAITSNEAPYIATVTRRTTEVHVLYKNGIQITSGGSGTTTETSAEVVLLGHIGTSNYSPRTLGLAMISDGLVSEEVASVNTIFSQYRSGL